jgi:mxaJ protein
MNTRGVGLFVAASVTVAAAACSRREQPADQRVLLVCADPNNLPFSDSSGGGFENHLASIVAAEMNAQVSYTWWAQRRGFVRNTLNARGCDVVMGVPAQFELTAVTHPYYRSAYAFVSRRDRALGIRSLDDSALRHLTIGVQLVGDDYANAPPAHALAKRGIVENVRGFNVQGDYRRPSPPARIIDAVANGDIDIAIAWGPLAGYFASRESVPLDVVPVSPQVDPPALPLAFDISMGVRRSDKALRDTLNAILTRRRPSIDSLLATFGVPVVERASAPHVASARPAGQVNP